MLFFLALFNLCLYVCVCVRGCVCVYVCVGEQPPSSMSPVIIHSKHREKVLVIGGSGGSQIVTGMATVNTLLLFYTRKAC